MLKATSRASFQRSSTTHCGTQSTEPPIQTAPPPAALIGKRHTSRPPLVTGLTTAYLGLSVGRGFIDVQDCGHFFSPRSPQPRKISGLRVVLSAAHLNAARNAYRHRHHM